MIFTDLSVDRTCNAIVLNAYVDALISRALAFRRTRTSCIPRIALCEGIPRDRDLDHGPCGSIFDDLSAGDREIKHCV
jgi:hypothetical protein